MKRRDYLRVALVGSVGALAGCQETPTGDGPDDGSGGSDGGGSGGSNAGNDGGDSTAEGEEKATESGAAQADSHIKEAVGSLNRVGYKLSETEEQLQNDPTAVEYDVEATLAVVESARSELDAAAGTATADQKKDIETLRNLATVMDSLARVLGTFQDADPAARLDEIQTTVKAEQYGEALTMVRDAKSTVAEAEARVTTATEAANAMDKDRLAALDAVEYERIEGPLSSLSVSVDSFLGLATGYEAVLLGREDLVAANDHIDAREGDQAKAAIGKAKAHFTTANSEFDAIPADAPTEVTKHLDRAHCQTDHLVAASDHFEQAATAYDEGNPLEAKQERDAGEAELDKVNDC
ncbi:hypothetical protein [Haloarchaeobius sp. DFWS5]|uniref:hypothetical protein n=1 Tax=Haloarchaeobius sp. DFWS5 TaxID=3446114 RepID=UPI003EBBFF62